MFDYEISEIDIETDGEMVMKIDIDQEVVKGNSTIVKQQTLFLIKKLEGEVRVQETTPDAFIINTCKTSTQLTNLLRDKYNIKFRTVIS